MVDFWCMSLTRRRGFYYCYVRHSFVGTDWNIQRVALVSENVTVGAYY